MNGFVQARSFLLLAVAAPAVAAQGKGVLGRDNAAFARELFSEGYADLAQNLCRVIEANDKSPNELLEVQALGFELRVDEARKEKDFLKRRDLLRATLDDVRKFLDENARTRVADPVRGNMPSLYLELSNALSAALAGEKDAEKRAALTQEVQQVYTDAKQELEKRVSDFAARLANQAGNQQFNSRQHEVALFNLARMNYQHALLFAEGSPERADMLEKSLSLFRDFGFEYPDSLLNFQGIIFQGLCHEAQGKDEDALTDYQDVILIREDFEPDTDGTYQVGNDLADVISGATLRKVELLTRLGRARQAATTAEEFMRLTPDALLTSSGPEVLKAKAEAEIAAGDIAGASASAQALVDLDPSGWGGSRGREILARLPITGLAPDKILKIAETSVGRGDYKRALDLCRQAREAGRGARDEHETGSASFLLTGLVYQRLGRLQEATVAYDCAVELYGKGKAAPEALYAAVNAYRELGRKERWGASFYAERADQRMQKLATQYPNDERAASAGIYQGQRREDERDFVGARDFYSKIPKESPSYVEAQFRLATATNLEAMSLSAQDKRDEAQPLFAEAEKQYRAAMELITKKQEETLDTAVQKRLGNFLVSCRMGLASLYRDTGKPERVHELLAGLEQKVTDPAVVANIWDLRITALQQQGKLDEAIALFESVILASPSATGVAGAAGVLARALDGAAQAQLEKDPQSKQAGELWRKAAHYYSLSVDGALKGTAPLDSSNVAVIAQRLYVLGLYFNAVPEGQTTFVDWQGSVDSPGLWEQAAAIYERLDAQAPSYRVAIERARTLAILGRVAEAETIYARLFDQTSLFGADATSKRFDLAVITARPELPQAYLEWGVATHLVGKQASPVDGGRLDRALDIYMRVQANYTSNDRPWWQAKYSQLRLLADRGDYDLASEALQSLKRNEDPEFDKGRFAFKEKFQELEAELSKKVFKRPPPPKPK